MNNQGFGKRLKKKKRSMLADTCLMTSHFTMFYLRISVKRPNTCKIE